MPSFSRYIVLLIFVQVFASVLADEKHFGKSDSTPQSEKATNSHDGLQKIESEERLGYLYINYEATKKPTKKVVYNTTQNITAFVEESEKPLLIVNGNTQGYIKSNESSFKNKVEENELSHVRLSNFTDRIPKTDKRLLTISRQEQTADSTMLNVHQPDTARIEPKRGHVLNKFQTSFQKAGTQERNKERYMKNGQTGIQIKQGIKKTERAKLGKWVDGLTKGEQRTRTGEDSRKNGRESYEKSRESAWENIEQTGGKVELDRAGSEWRKNERNEIRNVESDRESALESIEKSRKGEWKNIEEERKAVESSGEVERIGSEWNKGETTHIGTVQKNGEINEGRVEKSRMGKWRKKGGEGKMIDSKGEMDRIESELGKGETNEFRIEQSDGETAKERIEKSRLGEWRKIGVRRKAVIGVEELSGIESELRKGEKSEFRIRQSNRKTASDKIEKSRKGVLGERRKAVERIKELGGIDVELDKDEKNEFRTEQSNGKIENEDEWRNMIGSTEEQKQIDGDLSEGENSELRIGESNREKTAAKVGESDHRIEGKNRQYRTRYVGGKGQVDQGGGDETEYGRIGMVNEGQHALAGAKEEVLNGIEGITKPGSQSWEGTEGQDKTGQRWMEKMREGGRRVLGVHGKNQGGILEKQGELWIEANIGQLQGLRKQGVNGVGTQGGRMVLGELNERIMGEQRMIDRVDKGELRIGAANMGELKERLEKQESDSAKGTTEMAKEGVFRGKAVGGRVIKGMMTEQRRMNRDREGEGTILRKQERKAGMTVGINEYKGRSGKEIKNEQIVAESGIKERKTGWDKLLGVEGGGRDEY
ncbi:Hypothetical predicted protein [Paramuricea clavata]|uniref:Uncharacterized protein n=1 Tax=Paramuricea clavata TaxID=317549 RepID=A0A6S7HZA5_PARCT|nr:Hypothetical predicted protein [Paramuricea clavata]